MHKKLNTQGVGGGGYVYAKGLHNGVLIKLDVASEHAAVMIMMVAKSSAWLIKIFKKK